MQIEIREREDRDTDWIQTLLENEWGSVNIVTKGKIYNGLTLPGLIASLDVENVGLLLYRFENEVYEIVSLNSIKERQGVGSTLVEAFIQQVKQKHGKTIFLVTTNDNMNALRFYQKRGFVFSSLRPGAIDESRKIKPEIPHVGMNGIPIRDEIELRIEL